MTNLTIELPDDLARTLTGVAASQCKSLQQLALERLISLLDADGGPVPGSAGAILQAMNAPPHLSKSDVDELDSVIVAGRLPIQSADLFRD